MAEKKNNIFALLRILQTYSDPDHILGQKEILDLLRGEYGIEMDRRTLYSNLDALEAFGYETSRYEENRKGYYLITREFEEPEVLMIANAIHASHFIPAKASTDLIRKLMSTQSRYVDEHYRDAVYMPNRRKTLNQDLFLNIETASEAIQAQKCFDFIYLRFSMKDRQLKPRRAERYEVEPRYIVYADDRGYLICTSAHHPGVTTHYRLDRMKDVRILNRSCPPVKNRKDPYEYAKNKLFMYTGEEISVTLRCQERILDQMIDLFGRESRIVVQGDDHFIICVTASRGGIVYLAQQYLDAMEILDPPELRDEVQKNLEEALHRYKMKEPESAK